MTRPGVVRCLANIIGRHRVWADPVRSQDSASMQIQQSSGVQQRASGSDWRRPAALKRNPHRRGCLITTGGCHHQKESAWNLRYIVKHEKHIYADSWCKPQCRQWVKITRDSKGKIAKRLRDQISEQIRSVLAKLKSDQYGVSVKLHATIHTTHNTYQRGSSVTLSVQHCIPPKP
eukprot:2255535-Rhodomonas_salina.2